MEPGHACAGDVVGKQHGARNRSGRQPARRCRSGEQAEAQPAVVRRSRDRRTERKAACGAAGPHAGAGMARWSWSSGDALTCAPRRRCVSLPGMQLGDLRRRAGAGAAADSSSSGSRRRSSPRSASRRAGSRRLSPPARSRPPGHGEPTTVPSTSGREGGVEAGGLEPELRHLRGGACGRAAADRRRRRPRGRSGRTRAPARAARRRSEDRAVPRSGAPSRAAARSAGESRRVLARSTPLAVPGVEALGTSTARSCWSPRLGGPDSAARTPRAPAAGAAGCRREPRSRGRTRPAELWLRPARSARQSGHARHSTSVAASPPSTTRTSEQDDKFSGAGHAGSEATGGPGLAASGSWTSVSAKRNTRASSARSALTPPREAAEQQLVGDAVLRARSGSCAPAGARRSRGRSPSRASQARAAGVELERHLALRELRLELAPRTCRRRGPSPRASSARERDDLVEAVAELGAEQALDLRACRRSRGRRRSRSRALGELPRAGVARHDQRRRGGSRPRGRGCRSASRGPSPGAGCRTGRGAPSRSRRAGARRAGCLRIFSTSWPPSS